jgi:hypothetical protein
MVAVEQAQARSHFEVHKRSLRLTVRVKASNGYEGWITTEGHRRVTLTLSKGNTTIEARSSGRVTRHGINARFGDMGRISVRFHGRPVSLSPRNGNGERRCRGRKSAFEAGTVRGTIRFRGENGFTQMNSKRAWGIMTRHYRRVCRHDLRGNSLGVIFKSLLKSLRVTALRAAARVDGVNVTFEAAVIDFRPIFGPGIGLSYIFSAQTSERAEGLRLTRRIGAEGDERSFLVSRKKAKPLTATVAPPKPFTGTAKYLKQPGLGTSWIGSLAARLPGAGLVGMAGPGFKANVCSLTLVALLEGHCPPGPGPVRAHSLLSLTQDSGSQSQPIGILGK